MSPKQAADAPRTSPEVLFDRGLDSVGLPPRDDGETLEHYIARPDFGPNTRTNLARALEAAAVLDRVQVVSSLSSARQHHDDPNPPDSHPLKP